MDHFPIFLATRGQKILLSGGGEAALAKLRLLMKTEAALHVFAPDPAAEIVDWQAAGKLTLHAFLELAAEKVGNVGTERLERSA